MNNWISVKDRLPEVDTKDTDYESVWVIATNGVWVLPMIYCRRKKKTKTVYCWQWWWGSIFDIDDITHWMPLPEAPPCE